MIKISNNANPNYLAKIVSLDIFKEIKNADNIKLTIIDFQDVVVSKDMKKGNIVVFFPLECTINSDFLKFTNSFRDPKLNKDVNKKGFFEKTGRVKALKMMKGTIKSMGYVVPLNDVLKWANYKLKDDEIQSLINEEFDTINNLLICEKYELEISKSMVGSKSKKISNNRLIDNQVHLHVDTLQLRKVITRLINPNSIISISYKLHGTSAHYQNVLVKEPFKWYENIFYSLGMLPKKTKYELIYGSRKTIKNKYYNNKSNSSHFYSSDIWGEIIEEFNLNNIPKGFAVYGEIVGFTKDNKYIQKKFDYGLKAGEKDFYVYRITNTNKDGLVTELSFRQMIEFCNMLELKTVPLLFLGYAKEKYPFIKEDEKWEENFIKELEKEYLEKYCSMCKNKVPAEGIVVKLEELFSCRPTKLKSFNFLEYETKQLDNDEK